MKWILALVGAYLLYNYSQTGQLALPGLHPAVATPGTEVPLYGGSSITLPGGTTYHLYNGDMVIVPAYAQTSPGGWVQGTLKSTGELVWLLPSTGQVAPVE